MLEIKRALDRIDGKIGIAVDGGVLYLRTADMVLSVKLSNVVFPPYEQVIPEQHDRLAVCDRAELLSVLTRAEVMAPEKTATVRLSITPGAVATMTITADNPDLGVASQVIDIEFTGDAIVAGFNAHYMIEVLSAMESERVRLEFQGELDPCVLRPVDGDDYLGVVMPMRI
jgi:DNA polymerase-3 subunit beta